MPSEWTHPSGRLQFTDALSSDLAPRVLTGAAASLFRATEVKASLVECRVTKGLTEWRGVFLAGTRFVYVAVTKDREGWSASSELQRGNDDDFKPNSVEAWAVPLSALVRVELVVPQVQRVRGRGESSLTWVWGSQSRLYFETIDEPIPLPLFGHVGPDEHERRIEHFLNVLAA